MEKVFESFKKHHHGLDTCLLSRHLENRGKWVYVISRLTLPFLSFFFFFAELYDKGCLVSLSLLNLLLSFSNVHYYLKHCTNWLIN